MSGRSKNILRRLNQDISAQDKKMQEATEEIRQIKRSVVDDQLKNEYEKELPEHEGLVTKHHLRHARRIVSQGKRMGETIDRLPIHKGEYHQKNSRRPKDTSFEGPLLILIKKYGINEAQEHFSLGQYQKYEYRETQIGLEIWNIRTNKKEYPE